MFSMVLIFFVGSYAAMQAVFYLRVCRAYRPRRWARFTLIFLLLLAMISPFWSRLLDRAGMEWAARLFGLAGYTWLVIVFWFCCLTILVALWNLLARWRAPRLVVASRASVSGIAVLVAAALVWGWFEARDIRVREVVITTPRWPAGSPAVRLVQISDVHLGKPRGTRFAEEVAARVSALDPHILVSSGDLVDSRSLLRHPVACAFRRIEAPLGKYAVMGNHEYYTGLKSALEFHKEAGFIVLRGASVRVAPHLVIAGVDDPAANYTGQGGSTDELPALAAGTRDGDFVILLKHQPTVSGRAVGRFDLQLSGHTHGGQIFPFGILVRLMYGRLTGMHRVGDRSLLYISRGTGVWGIPIRLFARPEITVFVIGPASP